jgi:hypothetical protein
MKHLNWTLGEHALIILDCTGEKVWAVSIFPTWTLFHVKALQIASKLRQEFQPNGCLRFQRGWTRGAFRRRTKLDQRRMAIAVLLKLYTYRPNHHRTLPAPQNRKPSSFPSRPSENDKLFSNRLPQICQTSLLTCTVCAMFLFPAFHDAQRPAPIRVF